MDKVGIIGLDISKRLPGAWGDGGRGAGAAPQAHGCEGAGVPRVAAAVPGGDGDVRGCASLGAGDLKARPRGPADRTDIRLRTAA